MRSGSVVYSDERAAEGPVRGIRCRRASFERPGRCCCQIAAEGGGRGVLRKWTAGPRLVPPVR